ncbi:hypothetical protein KCQ_07152 [Pectobacterium atrosepticum ICMP 1526]|nr:hypothetical protein KCQ_07152 [Pectobacterium atrosepticum ICMP 1526]POW24369.1 hypothetical protein PB72LOC_04106 [Pectobacterium atrosepticum]
MNSNRKNNIYSMYRGGRIREAIAPLMQETLRSKAAK